MNEVSEDRRKFEVNKNNKTNNNNKEMVATREEVKREGDGWKVKKYG